MDVDDNRNMHIYFVHVLLSVTSFKILFESPVFRVFKCPLSLSLSQGLSKSTLEVVMYSPYSFIALLVRTCVRMIFRNAQGRQSMVAYRRQSHIQLEGWCLDGWCWQLYYTFGR
jgi:hypothetical protein